MSKRIHHQKKTSGKENAGIATKGRTTEEQDDAPTRTRKEGGGDYGWFVLFWHNTTRDGVGESFGR
jgi:hypothetical protein